MHHNIPLFEGDIFIADVHENRTDEKFSDFLSSLEASTCKPKQLFLCGDIFDLLVPNRYLENLFQKTITQINRLSKTMRIYYLEGNHDFFLQTLFPNVTVIEKQHQPIVLSYQNQKICVSHGDIYTRNTLYEIYCALIRNPLVLQVLNTFDTLTKHRIVKSILTKQLHKTKCQKIPHFHSIVSKKITDYLPHKAHYIIEGHYHQNEILPFGEVKYHNLSSFACSQSFFIVQSSIGNFSLLEVKSL